MNKLKKARETNERSQQIPAVLEDDSLIMAKIRSIIGRGNNVEIKGKKDGSLAVLEVKKNIV